MSEHEPEEIPGPGARLLPAAPMTRRDFHRRAARTAAGLLLAASLDSRAEEPPDAAPDESGSQPVPEGVPDGTTEGLKEAMARVRASAPSLPPEDDPELEAQVKSVLELARTLHASATPDGSEPASVFRALIPARRARS